MQRTTIMLPDDLKAKAIQHARTSGVSLGELIRISLTAFVYQPVKGQKVRDPFFADTAVYHGKTPKDLSANVDKYLYDEEL